MSDERYAAIRLLKPPRRVLVDPRRVWVMPVRTPERVMPVTLGEKAFALDLHLGEEWIPANEDHLARQARWSTSIDSGSGDCVQ